MKREILILSLGILIGIIGTLILVSMVLTEPEATIVKFEKTAYLDYTNNFTLFGDFYSTKVLWLEGVEDEGCVLSFGHHHHDRILCLYDKATNYTNRNQWQFCCHRIGNDSSAVAVKISQL